LPARRRRIGFDLELMAAGAATRALDLHCGRRARPASGVSRFNEKIPHLNIPGGLIAIPEF